MASNGGIIGPNKVIGTSQTKTTSFTSSGTFSKINCSSVITDLLVVAGGGGAGNGAGPVPAEEVAVEV